MLKTLTETIREKADLGKLTGSIKITLQRITANDAKQQCHRSEYRGVHYQHDDFT